jgi:O-antigen/teichoic acid export membrane protein
MLRKFAGNSIFYVLGMLLNRGLSFLLLPLYTRHLTPADYGVLAICGAVTAVLSAVITLSLGTSVSIFYFKLEREEYQKLLRTVWLWLVMVPLLVIGALYLVGPLLAATFLPSVPWSPYLELAVWISYFSIGADVAVAVLMAEQKAIRYIIFTISSFLITTLFLIYLVAVRDAGALGSLWGQLLAGVLMTAISHWIVLRRCWSWKKSWLNWQYLSAAIVLCVPLIPHSLSIWALNVSDRWILGHFVPLSDIGIYNLAYTLGMVVHFFGMGFNMAFTPLYFEHSQSEHFRLRLPKLLGGYLAIITWVTLGTSMTAPDILRVMTQPSFYGAAMLVPWIAASNWFVVGIYHQCMVVLENYKRTKYVILLTGPAAVLNICLNWLLVPLYGVWAAAINTLIAYVLMAVLSLYISRKMDKLPFPWLAIGQMVLVAVVTYWVGNVLLAPTGLGASILMKTGLLIIAGLLMLGVAGFKIGDLWALRKGASEAKTAA